MRISKFAAAALLGVAALGLSACANSLTTEVSRYQAMPAPQGQTFIVVPGEGMAANGGLEFQRYAGIVAQQLQARGYSPASTPGSASMTVQLGYGVDRGQVHVRSDPFYNDPFLYGYGGRGFFYPRYGFRSPFYYGWDDPANQPPGHLGISALLTDPADPQLNQQDLNRWPAEAIRRAFLWLSPRAGGSAAGCRRRVRHRSRAASRSGGRRG